MDAATIDLLASVSPDSTLPHITTRRMTLESEMSHLHDQARERFLAKYTRMNFGWYIAVQFANHRIDFPTPLIGRDMWVYKAFKMVSNPWNDFDDNIAEAYHLHLSERSTPNLCQQLKAYMLSINDTDTPEQHLRHVHKATGVPIKTLDAFEALFFNVIDRRDDRMYIAAEVYPDTRMVEMDENYLRNSSYADLLKRVAYNHNDMDLTAYLAGLGNHNYLKKLAASDDREAELTRFLMGNGLILAHANLLNQRSTGMNRVTSLLAASRQGGSPQEEPTLGGVASLYSEALQRAIVGNKETSMRQWHVDAGVLEV